MVTRQPKITYVAHMLLLLDSRIFTGAVEVVCRVPSLLPASSAFPRAATCGTRLTAHKGSRGTNCKMFADHEYVLFSEFRNCAGKMDGSGATPPKQLSTSKARPSP